MSHTGLMLERAFEQVIPEIQKFMTHIHLLNERYELQYRMEESSWCLITIFDKYWLREHKVACWKLIQLPGCCGICISTEAMVYPEYQKKGLGTFFNSIRIKLATIMGYGQIMCTVVTSNTNEEKILVRNNWTQVTKFKNPKTGNEIRTWIKDL